MSEASISIRGRMVSVPAVNLGGLRIVSSGRFLQTASVDGEEYLDTDVSLQAPQLIEQLRSAAFAADIFTFAQRLPNTTPLYDLPHLIDNLAVLPITTYDEWLNGLNQHTRRCVRLAARRGLDLRAAAYDDTFVRGIQGIYNETPVRQGRKFWHYGKDFETVKRENGTFLNTSEYIGAYDGEEMVGFLKMVYLGNQASIMQILSKTSCYEKKPMNALMAKAVEICAAKGKTHLIYRKYTYHRGIADTLAEFKRRNGFIEIPNPRYFVPLTIKGRLAVGAGLHHGLSHYVPPRLKAALLRFRERMNRVPSAAAGSASSAD